MRFSLIIPAVAAIFGTASAGPLAYGICQAGCSALVVSCYTAGGLTFGTITAGAGAPAIALACNASYGVCQAACAAAILAPTP
ncbi:cysteine-rich protein [Terfezia claveryi]|nr:cysteine-rich protein [Terfezia claveryi]